MLFLGSVIFESFSKEMYSNWVKFKRGFGDDKKFLHFMNIPLIHADHDQKSMLRPIKRVPFLIFFRK